MNQLEFDEFLRSISISKNDTYSLLLGAGSSISSGIPSASDCVWDWKGTIYKSNNPSTDDWIDNFKNPKVQSTIQSWLDNQGNYIENGCNEEYSFYAKKCFPIDKNRSQYFQKICSNIKPSIGYRTIPLLVKHGILDSVWTTNFDDLIMNSCVLGGIQGLEISLDTVDRINQRTQSRNELPIIKLHGDFKYGDLKNTNENNRQTFYIPTDGFDTTMLNITKLVVSSEKTLKDELNSVQQLKNENDSFTPFNLKPERINKVLKSNCFPLEFPDEVFVFDALLNEKPWEVVNDIALKRNDISAIPYQNKIWAFGTLESIKEAFKSVMSGDIVRKPLTDTRIYHSGINSLMLSAICKILSEPQELKTNYRNKIWSTQHQNIANQKVYNAIKLSLDKINGKFYLVFNPSFVLENEEVSKDIVQQVGITFYHKIWNSKFNDYVKNWSLLLISKAKYDFPLNSASGFVFKVGKVPLFTAIPFLSNFLLQLHIWHSYWYGLVKFK